MTGLIAGIFALGAIVLAARGLDKIDALQERIQELERKNEE